MAASPPEPAAASDALAAQARAHLQAGRLPAAKAAYAELLRHAPASPVALHGLGVIAAREGDPGSAIEKLERAAAAAPRETVYLGDLGFAYQQAGDAARAEDCYRRVLAIDPASVPAHNNLGIVLENQDRLAEARECYRRVVALAPGLAQAHSNLGNVHQEEGDLDGATACYRRALALDPDFAQAWENLGSAALWAGRDDEALAAMRRAGALRHDHRRPPGGPARVPVHRLRHDAEQARCLRERGLLAPDLRDWADALAEIEGEIRAAGARTGEVELDERWMRRIAPSFNRIAHVADSPALPEGALDPGLDLEALQEAYCTSEPRIVVVDGLLRPAALARLRDFCLESTLWKESYPKGYLGAYMERGFASPLLLQIQEELRTKLPRVFGEHRLRKAWGFKYDSRLDGIDIHADFAAVNVNFWITPDAANEDPAHGGLVLWDRAPPGDWGFRRYQARDKRETLRFLEEAGAKALTVPYRENRAVVFDSLLFHRTDDFRFAEGYENRRVNITLLYGRGRRAG